MFFSIAARTTHYGLRFQKIDVKLRNLNSNLFKPSSSSYSGVTGIASSEMLQPKVFVTRADVPEAGLDLLRKDCIVDVWESMEPIPKADLIKRVKDVDGLFCLLTDKIDEDVLNAAGSRLKVVGTMSVGHDHLDLKALKARNIAVGYTPGVLTDATAELTMAILFATARRLLEANKAIHKGEWKSWSPSFMIGPKIAGSNIGMVGLGRIGYRVAQYLKAFDVANIYFTSRKDRPEAKTIGAQRVDLDTLLKESDFVIVATSLVPETREMFNKKTFEKMKKSAIFINISRGEVVDQPALIQALKDGTIRAAGLDVMTPEPIPVDHELLQLDNCVVIPHLGSATTETRADMAVLTAQNILAVLHNQPGQMPTPLKF